MKATAEETVDPVVVEIIKGALKSCGDEMESVIVRTSMSPFIREKGDHFSGLTDRRARLLDRAGYDAARRLLAVEPADHRVRLA